VVTNSSIFWDITLYNPLKVNRPLEEHVASIFRVGKKAKQRPTLVAACFILVSCLTYSSALKMEATYSAETSVDFSTDYTALYARK
jgi:hypothetical protein